MSLKETKNCGCCFFCLTGGSVLKFQLCCCYFGCVKDITFVKSYTAKQIIFEVVFGLSLVN